MDIEIIAFSEEFEKDFHDLNVAWLQKYFVVEPIDNEMLSHPKPFIIDKGGYIFFAKAGEEIAGTFALIPVEKGVYELSKMAVKETFIGKKIGNALLEFCIEECKKLGASKIILYSNTKLEPAIHLYRKYGFVELPLDHSEYERANIKMEKKLK